ncbi:AAA family ATPase, partial [Carboxydocella sp. JDF658]|uniref:ATP-binding protein n=1 Tax=Carboxydocella sp. JDF658 TaxID=1926600 RepID=UPI0009D29B77
MRINKIKIKNYRQFKNFEIDFNEKNEHDLHILIGKNGMGKSNLLNAVNWCLYKDEPHLHLDSKALPILNLDVIKNNEENYSTVLVEVYVNNDEDNIIFKRESVFNVQSEKPIGVNEKFEVCIINNNGTKIFIDEDADNYVRQFAPKEIREYFFFDGERLNSYFREQTGDNIKKSIFEISNVYLLERIENRLNTIIIEKKREAAKELPDID